VSGTGRKIVAGGWQSPDSPVPASADVDQDLADRAAFDRGMSVGRLLERETVER
jgi:hypothetical protein